MRKKLLLICLSIVCLLVPHYAGATPLVEETALVSGTGEKVFDFDADQTPLEYGVWLTDLEFSEEMESLAVAITNNTDLIAQLSAPGMTTFSAVLGTEYFATVSYNTAGLSDSGAFGLLIEPIKSGNPVPEPSSMLLLGFGIIGLAGWGRKKFRKN